MLDTVWPNMALMPIKLTQTTNYCLETETKKIAQGFPYHYFKPEPYHKI